MRANGRSQLCVTGGRKEWGPQGKHLAEAKYHIAAINKRTGTLAMEYVPCGLRDLLWQSNIPALHCCSVNKAIKIPRVV